MREYVVDRLKSWPLYLLPHHALSRLVLWLTRRQTPLAQPVIRWFIRRFDVQMHDAVEPDPRAYPSFNRFFTRALRNDARPVDSSSDAIVSPADGHISALGTIEQGELLQAKGRYYSLTQLLADDRRAMARLHDGRFMTVYLSPRDYHRLHMPLTGELHSQTHIPGRLFGVAPHVLRSIPGVFARNERVVASFDSDGGLVVLVLVGAINVAAIETVWHGLVTPPQTGGIQRIDYTGHDRLTLARGAEMGRFNMGSTIIVLLENAATWRDDLAPGSPLRMGERIGQLSR